MGDRCLFKLPPILTVLTSQMPSLSCTLDDRLLRSRRSHRADACNEVLRSSF